MQQKERARLERFCFPHNQSLVVWARLKKRVYLKEDRFLVTYVVTQNFQCAHS